MASDMINPHAQAPVSLASMIRTIHRNRFLIWEMSKREIIGRYRGSWMGIMWSFLNPLLLLAVYTFVFSVVFKSRWDVDTGSKFDFALVLFSGLLVFGIFSESLSRAPSLILNNVNFVKRITFPLEILPCIMLWASLFQTLISLGVLLTFYFVLHLSLHWTVLYVPIVLFPLLLTVLGLTWFLASLGVFVRDMGQIIGLIVTVVMFMSPVFYPLSSIPKQYQKWLLLNPIAVAVEEFRGVTVFGHSPHWGMLGIYTVGSVLVAWLGYVWFQKTRKGFADVL